MKKLIVKHTFEVVAHISVATLCDTIDSYSGNGYYIVEDTDFTDGWKLYTIDKEWLKTKQKDEKVYIVSDHIEIDTYIT